VIAVESLRHLLAEDLEHVCRALLPDVKLNRAGEARGHATGGALWIVQTRGAKRGVCLDASTMKGANAFDFVMQAGGFATVPDACRYAENLLGLSDDPERARLLQAELQTRQEAAQRERELAARQRAADVQNRAAEWEQAAAIGADSPAAQYLAGRRCLPPPEAIDPSLRCAVSGRGTTLLARMIDPATGRAQGYHETWLTLASGAWRKRPMRSAKLVWGRAGGCIIPLVRRPGASTVILAEGIENGLTAAALWPEGASAAAAYAAGNLRAIALPPSYSRVVLVRDRDDNPRSHGPACRAAAILRWWQEGRSVTLLDAPAGYADLNEAAQDRGAQRNGPKPPMAEVWAQGQPVDTVPEVAAWFRKRGLDPGLPWQARAHPAIEAGGDAYPAVLFPCVRPDGVMAGMAARLLAPPRSLDPTSTESAPRALIDPWREWGEWWRGTAVPILPQRAGQAATIALDVTTAGAAGANWAVFGLDHWAQAALPAAVWSLEVIGAPRELRDDDAVLWREGLRRLHPGRELTLRKQADAAQAA
jgi:hypothetical protein